MKSIFVSGATSGIGLATVNQLANQGYQVFAGGLPSDNFGVFEHPNIIPIQINLAEVTDITTAVKTIQSKTDHLHGLVNNAGINITGALETLSTEQIRQQFAVNVFGHLEITRQLLPLLRQGSPARIVMVSSMMGKVALPMLGAYSMSKHALEAMVDILRLELSAQNIHVASIEPGAVATPMTDGMLHALEKSYQKSPEALQKLYQPLFIAMTNTLKAQSKDAVPVQQVVDSILHALTHKKPRTRYGVGIASSGLMMMRRFAPDEVGDAILRWSLGIR